MHAPVASLPPSILAAISLPPQLLFVWALGLLAGPALFARGLVAYRLGARVETIATSPLQGLAAGEVRVSGTVEPGFSVLVSRLQSRRKLTERRSSSSTC